MAEDAGKPEGENSTISGLPQPDTGLRSIGRYQVIEKIGEGGMGEVYLAWQSEPVHRKVALKIIRVGMNTGQVAARFESERQALALMEHPYIARIFDGGETADGLPYFVMEYVQGIPITHYSDQNRLSTHDRLKLFIQVCEAVQHAHHKAIVHRDLKPSNILISEQDGKPFPKVIDFGVAKALGEPLTDNAIHTQFGQFLGTAKYMSPEQVDPQAPSVDTRSDVYSLGVILYELLVGLNPLDSKKPQPTPMAELIRRLREEDPELPSRRIVSMGTDSIPMAQMRGTLPVTLRGQLCRELDWITMKALEKNRARRYGSAAEFAADLQRYLDDEIVLARPPNIGYRAGKFVRHHGAAIAIVSLVFISSIAIAVTMTIEAGRIARERDRANREAATATRASEFLADLFRLPDPMVAQGRMPSAREILDNGAKRIESALAGQPLVLARLQSTMAEAYENLGLYNQAEGLYRSSLQRQSQMSGPNSIETASIEGKLGSLHWRMGKLQEAEKELRETIETNTRLLGEDNPSTLRSRGNLASLYLVQGRYGEAEGIYRVCLEKMRRVLGENNTKTVGVANNLALALSDQGKTEEAEKLYLWVLETRKRSEGENHPHTLGAAANLAEHYTVVRRIADAERLHLEVLQGRQKVLGEDHPDTLMSLNNIGNLYLLKKDTAKAEPFLRRAYQGRKRVLGDKHTETLATGYALGCLLLDQGRLDEAQQLIQQSIVEWEKLFGLNHSNVLTAKGGMARVYYAKKQFAEAEKLFREALDGWRRINESHPEVINSLFNIACVSALQGKKDQALECLREAVGLGLKDPAGFNDPDLGSLRTHEEFIRLVSTVKNRAAKNQ